MKAKEEGYYLTKTAEGKWGVALWKQVDGMTQPKWWDDINQNGRLMLGIKHEIIVEYYLINDLLKHERH